MTEPRHFPSLYLAFQKRKRTYPLFPLFLWFFLMGGVAAYTQEQKKMPMIIELGLVRGQFSDSSATPSELRLDLLISVDAFYQIFYKDIPLLGGQLKKGSNLLVIPSAFMVEEPGTYVFFIQTRAASYHFKYEMIINTQIQELPPLDAPGQGNLNSLFSINESTPIHYDLEVYIRGNLAGRSRKKIYTGLSQSMRKALHNKIFESRKDPRDPHNNAMLSMPNQSLSISGLPALVYSLLKKKTTPYTPKTRSIEAEFIKKTVAGPHKRVKATLSLSYRVVSEKESTQ